MTHFKMPVAQYMSTPLFSVAPNTSAIEAERMLETHLVSALAVQEADGSLVGVVSRTDLLDAAAGETGETFRLPDVPVKDLMTKDPVRVDAGEPLENVARVMLKSHIHRVFVEKEGAVTGVLSSRDLMRAVKDRREATPAIEIATKSTVRVKVDDTISLAVERLDVSNKHGLIVVDGEWPVGTFSQVDALRARARDPRTAVEEVMNLLILVLPPNIPVYRAAGQALALGVRRILLVDDRVEGVLSTFDFARVMG